MLSEKAVSKKLTEWHIHHEFYLFRGVVRGGASHPQIPDNYNSALSVTILPSGVSAMSSLDGILIFRLIYPVVFSIVPIALHKICRRILAL
jgi:uncharacterized membrane protein